MNLILPPEIPLWISKMLPDNNIRYAMDVGNGETMHVTESGQGFPVLMLHGNPTWGFLYRRVMERLSGEEIRCIAPPKPDFKPTAFHKFSQMPVVSSIVFRVLGFPQGILHRTQGNPASISGNTARA